MILPNLCAQGAIIFAINAKVQLKTNVFNVHKASSSIKQNFVLKFYKLSIAVQTVFLIKNYNNAVVQIIKKYTLIKNA